DRPPTPSRFPLLSPPLLHARGDKFMLRARWPIRSSLDQRAKLLAFGTACEISVHAWPGRLPATGVVHQPVQHADVRSAFVQGILQPRPLRDQCLVRDLDRLFTGKKQASAVLRREL